MAEVTGKKVEGTATDCAGRGLKKADLKSTKEKCNVRTLLQMMEEATCNVEMLNKSNDAGLYSTGDYPRIVEDLNGIIAFIKEQLMGICPGSE